LSCKEIKNIYIIMKISFKISAVVSFIILGPVGCKLSGDKSNDFITINVTASYPKKELILQDFLDVEYIPLETNDEFLCQGFVQYIGKNSIVVTNRINDGDIFIFDRKGKGINKINRKGNGSEEYTYILGIILDEDNGEIFVNNYAARKIMVYDLEGNYIRDFKHKEGAGYDRIYNFDSQSIICHDGFFSYDTTGSEHSFLIISKEDGSITKEIHIPFEKKILTVLMTRDETNDMTYTAGPSTDFPIISHFGNWILLEASTDTIYKYSSEHAMTPFIVRTPSIRSMDPEIFLFQNMITDRYYFMETVKKEWDFEKQKGFPSTDLVYDKQEKAIFRYTVYNGDYSNEREVYMKSRPVGNDIATWQTLSPPQLIEAHKKGQLKGKLNDIAVELDEESNPVIMLAKHKK